MLWIRNVKKSSLILQNIVIMFSSNDVIVGRLRGPSPS